MDSEEPESKLISLVYQLNKWDMESDSVSDLMSLIIEVITHVKSMDLDSLPKPESEFMSLISQAISVFNSMDFEDSQPEPLKNLISLVSHLEHSWDSKLISLIGESFSLEPKPELISLISRIFTVVIAMSVTPEQKLISLISQLIYIHDPTTDSDCDAVSEFISLGFQILDMVNSMDLDSLPKPETEFMSLTSQAISFFNSMDLEDSLSEPLKKLISLVTQKVYLVNPIDTDTDSMLMLLVGEAFNLEPEPELVLLITRILNFVKAMMSNPEPVPDPALISLITELISIDSGSFESEYDNRNFISLSIQILDLVSSTDLNWLPKPESKLMSLVTQTISLFKDLDPQPKPLRKLLSLSSRRSSFVKFMEPRSKSDLDIEFLDLVDEQARLDLFSGVSSKRRSFKTALYSSLMLLVAETLSLEPEPELISFIHQIFSLVISMDPNSEKLISLCPRVQVIKKQGKFHVDETVVSWSSTNKKWKCLPLNWEKFRLPGERHYTYFHCGGCNGDNHDEYGKAPLEIKHPRHPKHSLQLVLSKGEHFRDCYCCDKDLLQIFYYCLPCDFAMNFSCAEKEPALSIYHPKWHEHTLSLFPRKTSLNCSMCALPHSASPTYMCPPCDFVIHQSCVSLPRVIRISRHPHRISFTASFDQRDWSCGVCQRSVDNKYGSYCCIKDGCSYVAHSKCATQSNLWDGIELEGVPEEIEEELEPFVRISDGIIQHFSHQHHHLKLDDNIDRDYDENKLCCACIRPIYFGNFYSCMQCDFILDEECANLSRKIHHPVHPHMLTLVGDYDGVITYFQDKCSACSSFCKGGFFYECGEQGCRFKLHVQCATVSEPLVHESHKHPLFLTSKPGDLRRCSICNSFTYETFNCIDECDFSLCFECATLPQKVRYKHDKHTLTLSYGEETSTMTCYWCEVCERQIKPEERFYMCDEYCCVTLHIECMLGEDLYIQPSLTWFYDDRKVGVLPNNIYMTRPICYACESRCQQKIVFSCSGLISCCITCLRHSVEISEQIVF